jgi:hypothetical protein
VRLEVTTKKGDVATTMFEFTIEPPKNQAPVISMPEEMKGRAMEALELDAHVQDDQLPQAANITWNKMLGPGDVSFDDAHAIRPKTTFTAEGRYVLRAIATDGEFATEKMVTVNVGQGALSNSGAGVSINQAGAKTMSYVFKPSASEQSVKIGYDLEEASHVEVTIRDRKGDVVRVLENSDQPDGVHVLEWDGTDSAFRKMPTGIYSVTIVAGKIVLRPKVALIR